MTVAAYFLNFLCSLALILPPGWCCYLPVQMLRLSREVATAITQDEPNEAPAAPACCHCDPPAPPQTPDEPAPEPLPACCCDDAPSHLAVQPELVSLDHSPVLALPLFVAAAPDFLLDCRTCLPPFHSLYRPPPLQIVLCVWLC